jgi:D-alanyl-D-alanine carboxypeptidase/D-alanyl-D-alanine-endopeptidase (penicillin-binding protein 4)
MTMPAHTSPTLLEDVVLTNKSSLNLHAELLLRRLGARFAYTGYPLPGTFADGAHVVRQFLIDAGIDKDDFVFYDGSGLSDKDLVTPRATAKLLRFAVTQPWGAAWKASLPVAGEDGSLAERFEKPPLKDHVFAKTGTLGEARALSGYLDCASGRTVIFSIMVGNHLPGNNADRNVMDKIVAAIAAAE